MLASYLKIALRSLGKQKLYALINILGLSIGIAICMLAYLYVRYEFSYDRWYPDHEQVYRINGIFNMEGQVNEIPITPYPLAGALASDLPEVSASTKVDQGWRELLVESGKQRNYVKEYARVDSSFFQIFAFPFSAGDPETALEKPDQVVISHAFAEQFFGNKEALGKTIKIDNEREYIVSGVLAKPTGPSHFSFDFYLPSRERASLNNSWTSMFNYYTYIKLHPGTDLLAFEQKLDNLLHDKLLALAQQQGLAPSSAEAKDYTNTISMNAIPVTDIHLDSKLDYELSPGGDRAYIYTFLLIGFIMLLIACINFMNLATARSAHRAKEIGVRKVVGANRFGASVQLLIEAMVQSFAAAGFAILLAELFIPVFNQFSNAQLQISGDNMWSFALVTLGFALLTSLLAGSYPAIFLSGFQPVRVLKGDFSRSAESASLRKGLVVFQFMVCAALIIFLLIVQGQISFMQNKELGFHPEQVIIAPLQTEAMWENPQALKNRLLEHPNITAVSASLRYPGQSMGGNVYESKNGNSAMLDFNRVDEHYAEVLGMELAKGRFFSRSDIEDTIPRYVVNETFVKKFELGEEPVGQLISRGEGYMEGAIVGVVKDFHWKGFSESIQATVFQTMDDSAPKVAIKMSSGDLNSTLQSIQQIWAEFEPNHPMAYTFLDRNFGKLYTQHVNFGKILSYLTLLIIFTAILGLFGLATYTTEQRTREIGIRKVLGASIPTILRLLIYDFARLVLIAALLSVPIGFWLSRQWLQDFAYQINISVLPFVMTIGLILIITIFTVGLQAYRVAIANPVKALKEE